MELNYNIPYTIVRDPHILLQVVLYSTFSRVKSAQDFDRERQ